MTRQAVLLLPALLAACGGDDPTPDPEDAAPAKAIEASVNRAENVAEEAQEAAEERNGADASR